MVLIDIDDPNASIRIREVLNSRLWESNLDAITEARNLVLEKYQLFPFLTQEIKQHQELFAGNSHTKSVVKVSCKLSFHEKLKIKIQQIIGRFIS
jgi:hypothetical protein